MQTHSGEPFICIVDMCGKKFLKFSQLETQKNSRKANVSPTYFVFHSLISPNIIFINHK
jgi:hypothetical protein